MNGKGFGRNPSWHNLRYYAGIRLERLRKTKKHLSIAGRRGRDLNPLPPECEAGILNSRPRLSIFPFRLVNNHLLVRDLCSNGCVDIDIVNEHSPEEQLL
jgi:hypothetical protein